MKRFIFGIILGLLLAYAISYASEIIVDFSEKSISILNDELSKMRWQLRDHETRIKALE